MGKNDPRILAIVTRELVEAEACDHKSCYRDYTRNVQGAVSSGASVVKVSEDTDVLVLLLAFKSVIPSSVFIKCGSQTRVKYIEVSRIVERVGQLLYADHCRAFMHSLAATRSVPLLDGER